MLVYFGRLVNIFCENVFEEIQKADARNLLLSNEKNIPQIE